MSRLNPDQEKALQRAVGTGRHKEAFMSILEDRLTNSTTALVMKGDDAVRGRCQELMDLITLFGKAELRASEE